MLAPLGPLARTAVLGALLVGCQAKNSNRTEPSASASAVRPAPKPPASLIEAVETPRCRVIAARPSASTSGGAGGVARGPAVGAAFDGHDWLELEAEVDVTLRHSLTTREFVLRGPGRFVPCFMGTETVLVARGSVRTTAGAGARAGAEVILATPFGTLHFADAALEVHVGEREMDTRVETGNATLVSATGSKPDAGSADLVLGPKSKKKLSGTVDFRSLLERCTVASRSLLAPPPAAVPSARAAIGRWSVAQLQARQAARWACAAARAAAGTADAAERAGRWEQIAKSDQVWQAPPPLGPAGRRD